MPRPLYPYQEAAVTRIVDAMAGRCIVALDPGLGKSAIACTAIARLCSAGQKVLIVAPTTLLDNWIAELGIVGLECRIVKKRADPLAGTINICSYDIAKNNAAIQSENWHMVVCDESHMLKEHTSDQARKILPLVKHAPHALLMSATPQLSRHAELWSQLDAISRGQFGTWTQFTIQYCNGQQGPFQWEARGSTHADELRQRMDPFVIRGKKKDLLNLPNKTRKAKIVPMADEDVTMFKGMHAKLKVLRKKAEKTKQKADRDRSEAFMQEMWRTTARCKTKPVTDYIASVLGTEKLVVFGHHVMMLDAVEQWCVANAVSWFRIDGSTPVGKRQQLVSAFSDPTNHTAQVAILSYTACCAGITLCPGAYRTVCTELCW